MEKSLIVLDKKFSPRKLYISYDKTNSMPSEVFSLDLELLNGLGVGFTNSGVIVYERNNAKYSRTLSRFSRMVLKIESKLCLIKELSCKRI